MPSSSVPSHAQPRMYALHKNAGVMDSGKKTSSTDHIELLGLKYVRASQTQHKEGVVFGARKESIRHNMHPYSSQAPQKRQQFGARHHQRARKARQHVKDKSTTWQAGTQLPI